MMEGKNEFTAMSTPPVEEFIEIEDLSEEFHNDEELESKLAELQMKMNANLQLNTSNNNNQVENPNNNNMPRNQAFDDKKMAKIAKEEAEYARYKELSLNVRDYSSVEKLNIIKIVGRDSSNRPIIMALPRNIPPRGLDYDLLLLYAIHILDPIVSEEYVLIYCNTDATSENRPAFSWLQKVYGEISKTTKFEAEINEKVKRYKKNLKALMIIHPSMWIKFILKLFRPFISEKFWRKLSYIDDINQVSQLLSCDVTFPNFVIRANFKSYPQPPIFGAPLDYVLRVEKNPQGIPRVVRDCFTYLENHLSVEGIFRMSGSAVEIDALTQCYNRRENVDLKGIQDPHSISGLLKSYLRSLPDPLICSNSYESFITTHCEYQDKKIEEWALEMARLINSLPPPHIRLMTSLFEFLDKAKDYSESSKMTTANLAIVFSPNIMKISLANPVVAMQHQQIINTMTKLFIDHRQLVFAQVVVL